MKQRNIYFTPLGTFILHKNSSPSKDSKVSFFST